MLANVPHQDMEDMAVVYRFVVNSDDEGRATILVTNQILDSMGVTAYSAKPAQPFQWNGALFRFNLNVVQID